MMDGVLGVKSWCCVPLLSDDVECALLQDFVEALPCSAVAVLSLWVAPVSRPSWAAAVVISTCQVAA